MRVFCLGPGVTAAVLGQSLGDPAWLSIAVATPGPHRPRTSRTQHSCGLRRPRSAEQVVCAGNSASAGPDTLSFPTPWPFKCATGSLPEGSVPLGRAHGRGGSSGDSSFLGSGAAAGVGGTLEGCFGTQPVSLGQLHAEPVCSPDPPPRPRRYGHRGSENRGHRRRPIKAAGCRGCGQGHPLTDSWFK